MSKENEQKQINVLPEVHKIHSGEPKYGEVTVSTQDIAELINVVRRVILPINQIAYETILNVVELTLIRDAVSGEIIAQSETHWAKNADNALVDEVTKIINDVDAELNGTKVDEG